MFIFLIVVQALIGAALVGIILVQKSEGGGLTGGSPSGFMSARGAADFLTRATAMLATAFVGLAIVLAAMAVKLGAPQTVDTSLDRNAVPAAAPLAAPASAPASAAPAGSPKPGPSASATPFDPLAGVVKK